MEQFELHQYEDEGLREIWLGYLEGPDWIVFIPVTGRPFVFMK